jgi:MFS family permease
MSEDKNKIDQGIESTANKIDQCIEEAITSKYMRILFRFVVSIAGGLAVGSGVSMLVYELSAHRKTLNSYTYTAHNEGLAITVGVVAGIVIFSMILKYFGKKRA